jgi:hypothetical protein
MDKKAVFDPTGRYRYSLSRCWDRDAAQIAFILLNPSTADHQQDDPTLRRCIQFAHTWGYGALEVVNLFALRTPYPRVLQRSPDPIGAECDRFILKAVEAASCVVMAWGNGGSWLGRDRAVLQLLQPLDSVNCLGLNRSGQPRHPLYLKATTQLIPFDVKVSRHD